jgi:hypothetical protein
MKAFSFNDLSELSTIEYDINKPIGKIYKSKIAYMCGIPLVVDWLDDKISDNQFATFILAVPKTGFAPREFLSKSGTIILFREDKLELTEDDVYNIWDFFASLMNYESYGENNTELIQYNTWDDMVKNSCMNEKVWNNHIKNITVIFSSSK